jgi:nickel/cobalt exporter
MLTDIFQQGATAAWLYLPTAVLLGALHGLEPGHSKTMMAAFIIAVRGTVMQAVLLGLCATFSHTLIVWVVALGGMYLWQGVDAESFEPYLQVASAVLIIGIALWMLWRTRRERHVAHSHDHDHHHDHGHAHEHEHDGHSHDRHHAHDHEHDYVHVHGHDHSHGERRGLDLPFDEPLDAHALAHAKDIERRFANRQVTTGQIVMFGLTGGLVPCGAAVTVLLLCLQTGRFLLGVALVLCFSIGLALTLVAVGAAAAFGAQHAAKRLPWFGALATTAPYLSSVLILVLGLYVGYEGVAALAARAA